MRAWAEINLDAIKHNYNEIRRITNPKAKIMAIIKADAYGHGFEKVASVLEKCGVDALGVATANEALEIRKSGFSLPVLILGVTFNDEYEKLIENDISLCVSDLQNAYDISKTAVAIGKTAKIHIKLDTGMGRIGFVCNEQNDNVINEILEISKLPKIKIEGIFSHFAKADEKDPSYTHLQFDRFIKICNSLEKEGLNIPLRHICNSGGIIDYPDYHLDMVRSGIITYGLYPSEEVSKDKINLIPAMTLKAKIIKIKEISSDSPISYGGKHIATKGQRIATIAIGYADGFSRVLSNKAKVLVNGSFANVVGNICMDQCMIDVTDITSAKCGDDVILFGFDGNNNITVESVALLMGTINYEVVCSVTRRVPRAYIQNNQIVTVCNRLD